MQCSVSVTVEVDLEAGIVEWEQAVQEAGWEAMRRALAEAVRAYEGTHATCPRCGQERSRGAGTVRRVVLTVFGRVVLGLGRRRCLGCGQRFRPGAACLAGLGRGRVTPALAAACALAGASWPFAVAAEGLRRLSGAQVSAEQVRRQTRAAGAQEAQAQQAQAERVLAPTAAQVRAEREAAARAPARPPRPERLVVGLDGGWVPSREQAGGMEGKVGVVATARAPVGAHGRWRLAPRRYVATFAAAHRVGALAAAAAAELGGYDAREQVILGDGAAWIKTQATDHFPDATGILDWAHVERAIHKAIRAACPGPAQRARRRELHAQIPDTLWQGDVDGAVTALRMLRPLPPDEPCSGLEAAIAYLEGQRAWLGDYAAWREAGFPIGSGLIERAVALVINRRMKGRGMRWLRTSADGIVALRVRELNAHWDDDDDAPTPLAA